MKLKGISHGKMILSGEHSVVYGYPALAFPIPLTTSTTLLDNGTLQPSIIKNLINILTNVDNRLTWDKAVVVESTIPMGSGLGSSAALAHSLVQALCRAHSLRLNKAQIFNLVQECEKYFHVRPSGIDAATVVYNQAVRLQKNQEKPIITKLPKSIVLPPHQLIFSGQASESTKEMVEKVAKIPNKESILAEIGAVTSQIENQLHLGRLETNLITTNERLLEKLGVVGDTARTIIAQVEKRGGHAKIVGAGGCQTGSGMILAFFNE